jgi:hypothetical protein
MLRVGRTFTPRALVSDDFLRPLGGWWLEGSLPESLEEEEEPSIPLSHRLVRDLPL